MNSPRPYFLLPWVAVVLLSSPACINVPDIEPTKAEVHIASPEGTAYTNGVLEVRLTVTGHTPEQVELLRDGEVLTTLEAPYTYAWDTAEVAEGTYRLEARAVFGEVVFTSEARNVVVDRTPPQVVSRTPEPGAQEVWVKSPIRAVFSEPVKASTLTEASLRLTVGGVEVARTVSLSADGRTVTVEPVTPVAAPNTVSLVILDALTDLAGNKASELSGDWNWVMPEFVPYPPLPKVNAGASFLGTPLVRLDKNGNPVVAQLEHDNKASDIIVSRWTGSAWEHLGTGLKTRPAPFFAELPSLQIAPDGNPVVAWHEGTDNENESYTLAAHWTGSTWKLFGDNQGILPSRPYSLGLSLELTSEGLPIVAFNMAGDPEGGSIHVYYWSDNEWKPFGLPIREDTATYLSFPALALDNGENPIIAFYTNTPQNIRARRWNGDTWENLGTTINTSTSSYSIESIRLTINKNNQPVAFWIQRLSPGGTKILASQWNSGNWLPMASPSSTEQPGEPGPLNICRSPDNNPILSWGELDQTALTSTVYIHHWTGGIWERAAGPIGPFNANTGRFIPSSIDNDSKGNFVLAGLVSRASQPYTHDPIIYRHNH